MFYNGFQIIFTGKEEKKYPSGKKDGNKLGARKRNMLIRKPSGFMDKDKLLVEKDTRKIYIDDPIIYDKLLIQLKRIQWKQYF